MTSLAIEYTPKTTIKLSGSFAKKYGQVHHYLLGSGDIREAVKAIDANHPSFARDLANAHTKGLEFAVFRNRRNIGESELDLSGRGGEIRIAPVLRGSKRGGAMQTIVGAVLVVVGP